MYDTLLMSNLWRLLNFIIIFSLGSDRRVAHEKRISGLTAVRRCVHDERDVDIEMLCKIMSTLCSISLFIHDEGDVVIGSCHCKDYYYYYYFVK